MQFFLAAAAAWLSSLYLDNKEKEIKDSLLGKKVVKVPIIVPKVSVKPGDIISSANMVVREVPKKYVPDGAFSPKQFKGLVGRTIISHISNGKPLLENSIAGIGIEQFSDLLEDGHRAITLSMDEFNSTAGMLVAGDRIDLFLLAKKNKMSGKQDKEDKTSALYLILENGVVLATGKKTVEDKFISIHNGEVSEQYSTITLGVPLKDAGRIGLARKDGDFVAMLRNREDVKKVRDNYIDSNDVYTNIAANEQEVEFIIGGSSESGLASVSKASVKSKKMPNKLALPVELTTLVDSIKK